MFLIIIGALGLLAGLAVGVGIILAGRNGRSR
jgi:hypothetical protein